MYRLLSHSSCFLKRYPVLRGTSAWGKPVFQLSSRAWFGTIPDAATKKEGGARGGSQLVVASRA